jgi:hypothetical protein
VDVVRNEFMQRLYVVLHGTLGSYLRDAYLQQEAGAAAVAYLPAPRAQASLHHPLSATLFPFVAGGFHCFLCNK